MTHNQLLAAQPMEHSSMRVQFVADSEDLHRQFLLETPVNSGIFNDAYI